MLDLIYSLLKIRHSFLKIKAIGLFLCTFLTSSINSQNFLATGSIGGTLQDLCVFDYEFNLIYCQSSFGRKPELQDITSHPDGNIYGISLNRVRGEFNYEAVYRLDTATIDTFRLFILPELEQDDSDGWVGLCSDYNSNIYAIANARSRLIKYDFSQDSIYDYGELGFKTLGDIEFFNGNLYALASDSENRFDPDYLMRINIEGNTVSHDTVFTYEAEKSFGLISMVDSCESHLLLSAPPKMKVTYFSPHPGIIIERNVDHIISSGGSTAFNSYLGSLPSMRFDSVLYDSLICGDVKAQASAHMRDGRYGVEYSIDGMDYQSSPFFDSLTTGAYTIKARDDWGCSTESDSFYIREEQFTAEIELNTDYDYCDNTGGVLSIISNEENRYEYSVDYQNWSGDNFIIDLPVGEQSLFIRDERGCVDTVSFTITPINSLEVSIIEQQTDDCPDPLPILIDASGGVGPYRYFIDDIQLSDSLTRLNSGSWDISIIDSRGCSLSINYILNPDLGPSPLFINTSGNCGVENGELSISSPVSGLEYSIDSLSFQSEGRFTGLNLGPGRFWVKTEENCIFSYDFTITMDDQPCDIFLPEAFTPNGDAVNELWKPLGNVEIIQYEIFNRQGNRLFYGDKTSQGWDGRFNGGVMPTAVYTVKVIFRNSEDQEETIWSTITLLR